MKKEKITQDLRFYQATIETELLHTLKTINFDLYASVIELFIKAKENGNRIHISGIGKPSYVAGYIASLFSSTGSPAYVLDGTEAIHGSSGQVLSGDIVIAISNSGNTEELIKSLQTVKNNGAKLVGVSGNRDSWMAKNCDAFLFAGVSQEGGPLNKAPRASYLAEIIVLQGLSVILQSLADITLNDYKKWHPGGALGQSIQ